jgi:prephenate dehydrogenase
MLSAKQMLRPVGAQLPKEKICIWGAGLIGASLAGALSGDTKREILAVDTNVANIATVFRMGWLASHKCASEQEIQESDIHVIAIPVRNYREVLTHIHSIAKFGAIISDVGSTKVEVVALASEILGDSYPQFVPAHPIAGGEKGGAVAADRELFAGKQVVICSDGDTNKYCVQRVSEMWKSAGASVCNMSPIDHDRTFAVVSHTPHVVSYAYLSMLQGETFQSSNLSLAGSGFKDFSRIAGASPEIWRDICLSNRKEILATLQSFDERLNDLRVALERSDEVRLFNFFVEARCCRSRIFPEPKLDTLAIQK